MTQRRTLELKKMMYMKILPESEMKMIKSQSHNFSNVFILLDFWG